ncbi:MAG: hypothetical protein ACU0AT_07765 [Tranquillimonas sp.]|jgi:hypothetical protein
MTGSAAYEWAAGLDPRIWQAFVAGAFVALGWLVNGWQNRAAQRQRHDEDLERDRARRAERIRDVHRALYAEIGAYLHNLGSEAQLDGFREAMLDRMRDPAYLPLIPSEREQTIFAAIVGEIHVLPRTTIDPVVLFHRQLGAIAALIDDMRSDAFARATSGQRQAIYSDYIEMKKQALRYGEYALRLITVYADHGAEAAKDEERRINAESGRVSSPAADPSAPSSG